MMINNDKIFFNPGDKVKVKHELDFCPVMYVVEKVTRSYVNKDTNSKENTFIGIKCRWYDSNFALQEAIFSTKDLTQA